MEEHLLDHIGLQKYNSIAVDYDDDDGWEELDRGVVRSALSSNDLGFISSSSENSSLSLVVSEEEESAISNDLAMAKDGAIAMIFQDQSSSPYTPQMLVPFDGGSSLSYSATSVFNQSKEKQYFENCAPEFESFSMMHEKYQIEAARHSPKSCEIDMHDSDLLSDDGNCSMMELLGLHFPHMQQELSSLLSAATASKARNQTEVIAETPKPSLDFSYCSAMQDMENDLEANSWDMGVLKSFEGIQAPAKADKTTANSKFGFSNGQWSDMTPELMSYPTQDAELPPALAVTQMETASQQIDLVHLEFQAATMETNCRVSVDEQKDKTNILGVKDHICSLSFKGMRIDLELSSKKKNASSFKNDTNGRIPDSALSSKATTSIGNVLINQKPAKRSTCLFKLAENDSANKNLVMNGRNVHTTAIERQDLHISKRLKKCSSFTTSTKSTTANRISEGQVMPHKRSRANTRTSTVPALNTNLKPRARQGSASDPQSIAARHRRERISRRLKLLQELIPNGSKVDLVTMLEKAINYVKLLQLQVKVNCILPHFVSYPFRATSTSA
ncbi:hypothetical protein O6H91_01G072900 [Diphasiastrum complanatum]|uniref:Uncharacterized protein n=1 Tax=Diphasiastrum complanatum TaxID=34168 RepID=A0ACC2ES65_DIPCM|nr:hypothetical protein O6H91_01G072900 [Diphasiastrum complanatum]